MADQTFVSQKQNRLIWRRERPDIPLAAGHQAQAVGSRDGVSTSI
jgi:hypothetical protein